MFCLFPFYCYYDYTNTQFTPARLVVSLTPGGVTIRLTFDGYPCNIYILPVLIDGNSGVHVNLYLKVMG